MAKMIELCKVHSFNLCQRTTVCNTDAPNCYIMRWLTYLYRIPYLCIINSTEGATWFNNFVVLNILW